uniref:Kringle domain-containing protein n=1 Tax=Branchiostoma floridae TaxID=7739 RepID=C3XZV2_BRAFL|eukprot:XP_002610308.1 hypothetical protein BRAFLDRAFT_84055 [Branchiostoma floridae]
MAAVWVSFVLAAACFSSLDAAIIKDTVEDALFDSMPDEDDEKDEVGHKWMLVLRGDERRVIPFWNRTKLCNYHECFRQLKTWPEVPYYLLKDGHFLVDWPTKYIRMFLIYNKNAFVKVFNKDRQAVENHALETVAIIDKAYRTVNFRVLLSGVEILEEFWPGETENPHYSQYLKPKVREHIWSQLQSSEKKFDTAAYIAGPPYWHGTSASGAGMGDLCVVKDVNAYPFMMIGNKVFSWLLRAPVGQRVRVVLTVPQMMSEYFEVWIGCPYDWIEVRDGGEVTSPLIGRYCAPLRNPILWSSSNEMLVRLRSDSSFDSHFVIGYTFKPKEDSKDEEEEEKTCQIGDGSSYRGTLAATWSGRLCQAWGVQAPHSHSRTPANYPNSGLDKNYCRNPSGHHNLWCYTADPDKRWDSCVLRKCDTVLEDLGAEVQDLIKDAGGHTCQAWSSQTPHSHSYTPEKYPNAGLTNNYCRNPSKSDAPWCYTTSSKRWAFCAIPKCMENEGT